MRPLNPRLLTIPQLLSGKHPSTIQLPVLIRAHAEKHKFKYSIILTTDEDTPGYISSFIVVQSNPLWGFHLLWTPIDGGLRSCTAGFKLRPGKIALSEFGKHFLKTFNLVMTRQAKAEHVLGDADYIREVSRVLSEVPKYATFYADGKIKDRDAVNLLLMSTYRAMWDLDLDVSKFEEIPQDVVDDYHAFVDQEFGD